MTTRPKASKFRVRRNGPPTAGNRQGQTGTPGAGAATDNADVASPQTVSAEAEIDAIRKEGLTGRQLRMARRVAQKNGLAVVSDFDAVMQLRQRGIDPFQRANVLELVSPNGGPTQASVQPADGAARPQGGVQLPQTVVHNPQLPSTKVEDPYTHERRAREISDIQRDIARRRRRNIIALVTRLTAFVLIPTFLIGWYFYVLATPMYATKSEFVIQQADSAGSSGFGGLFQGTGLATQSESVNAQSYLTSREALLRLDADHDYIRHFQQPEIDAIQRLDPDATNEDAYKLYQDMVLVGYDPTEGTLKMEVIAADPAQSQLFAESLIRYAEERVDNLTQRMREDQMADAIVNYEDAEFDRQAALRELTQIQTESEVVDPTSLVGALQSRINVLELSLDQKQIELASLQANNRPNQARVSALQGEIARTIEQIALLRGQLSEGADGGLSQTEIIARLREAEENYAFAIERVTASQASMEQARIQANRQVRFLSVSVLPIAPDQPTYPRAFESTLLAFFVFAGIYLLISLTASILREQVSS